MEILVRQSSFQRAPADNGRDAGLKIRSLLDLPAEILFKVFRLVPNELKAACKTCYMMYNERYAEKLTEELGNDIMYNIAMFNLPYLVDYIRSFDYWRRPLREMVENHYQLPDYEPDFKVRRQMSPKEVVHCKYVKDSWKLIYGIYKNRRLFVEYQDYQIDEPQSHLSGSMLHVNKTYLVKYKKTIQLSADLYNLSCGIIVQNALGLGSMNFKVRRTDTKEELLNFYPPTNINELVPHGKFVLLNLGDFHVVRHPRQDQDDNEGEEIEKLIQVDIIMEETGLYLKSGFIICYIDVNAYPQQVQRFYYDTGKMELLEEKGWIAWSIDNQPPTPDVVVNKLLKRLYKSINRLGFLKPMPSPFQRIGSFAEISKRRSSVTSMPRRRKKTFASAVEMSRLVEEGPVAEAEPDITGTYSEVTSRDGEEEDDELSELDIDNYNRKFFSPFNEQNELITRTFRFRTVIDRRQYDSANMSRRPKKIETDDPVKWKLTTVFEL